MNKLSSLRGSMTPIVTPFRNGEVDYDTYARLVDWQIANGGHGVLVNGTTAEPSTLTTAERNRLVDVAIEAAAGRVPVIAATGSQSLIETLELTSHADKAGADGLLVVTPYYIKPPQRGLVEYYAQIGDCTERPLMIYHIPGRAAVNMDLATVKAIRDRVPNLVGMKHAVNDMGFVTHMLDAFGPDWRVFVGLEELSFPMLAVGACGLMNAVGNLAPRKVADLCEAVDRGDLAAGRKLHFDLFELNLSVFFDTNPIPIKYMMKRLGLLPTNEHRLPMVPATPDLEKRLDHVLERAGLL
ncbi:4-hydroxy-tetrahydrodipicolinate synthase [Burkholderia cenocepacia]|uniref:4-hydroxy-tetrahydrodipicolinate synthase n=1 Tax=Burkholderia cenocepacia TaxID=95486 RepID=UPI0008479121|nr:4-hydroxy-tetrahydrodipicolinate synthase [Burkholderia cenocepacia]